MRIVLIFIPLLFLVGCQATSAYDPHYIMSEATEDTVLPPTPEQTISY